MRRTSFIMGTAVSLDIPGCDDEKLFERVFKKLVDIDEQFSPYKEGSELSRYQRGEISQKQLSPAMRRVIKACARVEKDTGGYFSANFSDRFDPTGYVKSWAIAEAGKEVEAAGQKTYCLSVGGDILARSDGGKKWQIGVQDPSDPHKILNKLSISSGAVATSGAYERGDHIINPKTGQPTKYWASVTVSGQNIVEADILATAVFAGGKDGLRLMSKYPDYQVLAVAWEIVADDLPPGYAKLKQ